MSLNLEIKKIDTKPIKNNSDNRICFCQGINKVWYTVTLHKSEVELVQHLKEIKKNLSIKQFEKLVSLINAHGDQRFSEGLEEERYNRAIDDAGADY